MADLKVERIPQDPRLGRQLVHDERSRAFALMTAVDRSTWRNRIVRIYDPVPNPKQLIGLCTGAGECMMLNSAGNRVKRRVLDMPDAERIYSLATTLDPWPGSWPPEDTGSSGLAAAKAAQTLGLAGEYRWIFGGADEVVQNVIEGRVISVGTWWYASMFNPDVYGRIIPTGKWAGGHQYVIRGYDAQRDWVMLRCWWGSFRDAWMPRSALNDLLLDDGDAHFQQSV